MGLLVSQFPRGLRLVSLGLVFPVVICSWEALVSQHWRAGEKEEGVVRDGTDRSAGLPLGVLEHINILGDDLNLKMVALHLVVQRQEVEGVPAGAPYFQVCEQVFWADLGVNGIGVLKFSDPCVRNDSEHELCRLPSRGFKGGAVCVP